MKNTNESIPCQLSKTNAAIQCSRLLERLKHGPISTFQAREQLHIAHVACRIHDLRRKGYNIETHTCKESTTGGAVSRVALYILTAGPEEV